MAAAKTKRTYDSIMADAEMEPLCPQYRPVSPADAAIASPPSKRPRPPLVPLAASRAPRESFFTEPRVVLPSTEEIACMTPKRMRLAAEHSLQPEERLYSLHEVRQIVARAISEHEAKIRIEYDRILQQRLAEQFQSFSRFNQDHVARQMRESECSYLS